jgi:hypothetical protein
MHRTPKQRYAENYVICDAQFVLRDGRITDDDVA